MIIDNDYGGLRHKQRCVKNRDNFLNGKINGHVIKHEYV